MSIDGATEDDTTTDPRAARRKLRQRAEIARGRGDDESPKYDRHNFKNGRPNGRTRGREFSEASDYSEYERRPEDKHNHTNGGYKYSDESQQQTEHESDDDDMKKEFSESEEEEDDRRNSFTPVKFKPAVEKEQDSIQLPGNGTVQYLKQDDSGSVDFSDNGRHLARSMSSFSAHDTQDNTPRYGMKGRGIDAPTPPPSLPLNIPAKLVNPPRPQPRPVPAPRPKPLPSTRSYGSKEDLADPQEVKLNNLSQDEASSYRGSRDRLDDQYAPRKAPSRENLNDMSQQPKYLSRSREKVNDPQSHQRFPSNDTSEGRNSPLHHGSRENLLPKRQDSDNYRPPPPLYEPYKPPEQQTQDHLYDPTLPYSYQGSAPGVDYMPRADPNKGMSGVGYLPRNLGTPMKSRVGQQPTPSSSDYESYDGGFQPQTPRLADTTPGHYDYHPQTQYPDSYSRNSPNVPYSPAASSNVDYLPRNNLPQTPNSYMSRSRENLSHSRENMSQSRENLPSPRPYGNVSRSRENLSRSRENLGPSRPYDNDIRENSMDVVKPRQQKSIETEI